MGDLGSQRTLDVFSIIGNVVQQYVNSTNSDTEDPDNVRYVVSLSFAGVCKEKEYCKLDISEAEPPNFCIQPAGMLIDTNIDPKHSLAWVSKGPGRREQDKKVWVVFLRTEYNEHMWEKMHKTIFDYERLIRGALRKGWNEDNCCPKPADLVFILVGWFHGGITLGLGIQVGSWIARNGHDTLCTLHFYM